MIIHHYLVTFFEFLIVLIIFVIPSFSAQPYTIISIGSMLISLVYTGGSSLLLLIFLKYKTLTSFRPKFSISLKNVLFSIIILSLLLCLSLFFGLFYSKNTTLFFQDSNTLLGKVLVPFWLFFLASFEEILFRLYLPEKLTILLGIIPKNIQSFITIPLTIFIPTLLFAFAHSYSGKAGIIYAFFSGLLLFFLRKKTGSILYSCLVHFIYNASVILISSHFI